MSAADREKARQAVDAVLALLRDTDQPLTASQREDIAQVLAGRILALENAQSTNKVRFQQMKARMEKAEKDVCIYQGMIEAIQTRQESASSPFADLGRGGFDFTKFLRKMRRRET